MFVEQLFEPMDSGCIALFNGTGNLLSIFSNLDLPVDQDHISWHLALIESGFGVDPATLRSPGGIESPNAIFDGPKAVIIRDQIKVGRADRQQYINVAGLIRPSRQIVFQNFPGRFRLICLCQAQPP